MQRAAFRCLAASLVVLGLWSCRPTADDASSDSTSPARLDDEADPSSTTGSAGSSVTDDAPTSTWVDCARPADTFAPMCQWLAAFDTESSPAPLAPVNGTPLQNWAASAIATNRACASFKVTELLALAVDEWDDWSLGQTAAVFAAAVNSADPGLTLRAADTMARWPAAADPVRLAIGDRLPLGTPIDVVIPDVETRRRIVRQVIDSAYGALTPAEHASMLGRLAWPWATGRDDAAHQREELERAVASGVQRWIGAGGTHAHAFVIHVHSVASLLGHVVGRDAWALMLRAVESALVTDLAQTPVWSVELELQLIHSLAQMVPHAGQATSNPETMGMALGAAHLVMARIEAPRGDRAADLTPRWQWAGTVPGLAHALLVSPLLETADAQISEGFALASERGADATHVAWGQAAWSETRDALREGRAASLPALPSSDDPQTTIMLHALQRILVALDQSTEPVWCERPIGEAPLDAWLRLAMSDVVECPPSSGPRDIITRNTYSAAARLQMDGEVNQFCEAVVSGLPQELAAGRGITISTLGTPSPAHRTLPATAIDGVIVWDGQSALVPAVGPTWNPGPLGRFRMGASLRLPEGEQWRMASATEAIELMQAMLTPSPVASGPSNVEWMVRRRSQLVLPPEELADELQREGYLFTGVALANARVGLRAFGERTEVVERAELAYDGSAGRLTEVERRSLGAQATLPSLQAMIALMGSWSASGVPLDDMRALSELQAVLSGLVDDGLANESEGLLRLFCQLVQPREGGGRLCAGAISEMMTQSVPRTPDGLGLVEIAARDAMLRNQPDWAAEALTRGLSAGRISLGPGRYVELSLLALQAAVAAG